MTALNRALFIIFVPSLVSILKSILRSSPDASGSTFTTATIVAGENI